MPHLDPSYLRYIYDSLIKGSIHPENAAELPEGLIGLYEEAFDERQPVHERQQLLERFAIWALLKKEVSAQFVAEVLEQPFEEIQDFISTYSAWFNSPESGKYQLYHERLKVYLLQKLSEQEIYTLHEKLISRLEKSIVEQKAGEFEWYGLEFLIQHYALNAMLTGNGSKLLAIAYDQNHWQRQLKISKGYNWTKAGLHAAMSWASKYNDDEVIECGLQMVDLNQIIQNSSHEIVHLIRDGKIKLAIDLIASFGGNSPVHRMRRCLLYLCSIATVTLLRPKSTINDLEEIHLLIESFKDEFQENDEQIEHFFSSVLLFKMACELKNIGINHLFLCDVIDHYDGFWIKTITINDEDIEVLNTLLNAGSSSKYHRVDYKTEIKDLKPEDRNRTYSFEKDAAFYDIDNNQFKAEVFALKGDFESSINCFINSLVYKKYFSPGKSNLTGGRNWGSRDSMISDCVSNSKLLKESNFHEHIFLIQLMDRDTSSDVYQILPVVGNTKLALIRLCLDANLNIQVNEILHQLHKVDNHWFNSGLKIIAEKLISNYSWPHSLKFVTFISGIYLFDDRDLRLFLNNYQKEYSIPLKRNIIFEWLRKALDSGSNEIKDVHLKTVVLIDRIINRKETQGSNISTLLNNIDLIRINKIKCLVEFFIQQKPYNKDLLHTKLNLRLNSLNNEDEKLTLLFKVTELFNNNDLTEDAYGYRTLLSQKIELLDETKALETKIKYYSVLDNSLDGLVKGFLKKNEELMLSWNGNVRWNETLFELVYISIKSRTNHWNQLIGLHVENRHKLNDPLSFIGHLKKSTELLCSQKNYTAAYQLINSVPERSSLISVIAISYLEIEEYDKLKELIYTEISYGRNQYFMDELVKVILIKKDADFVFSKIYASLLSNSQLKFISFGRIPHFRVLSLLKMLDFQNIEFIESILAKYSIDRLLMGNCKKEIYHHLDYTLDLNWYDKSRIDLN
jgi:hypothetical protein